MGTSEQHERDQQMEFEHKLLAQKLEFQRLIAEAQPVTAASKTTSAKLPKLVITRFNGSYNDWLRFWGQFSVKIDEEEIPDVMKFSYISRHWLNPKYEHVLTDYRLRTTVSIQDHPYRINFGVS